MILDLVMITVEGVFLHLRMHLSVSVAFFEISIKPKNCRAFVYMCNVFFFFCGWSFVANRIAGREKTEMETQIVLVEISFCCKCDDVFFFKDDRNGTG